MTEEYLQWVKDTKQSGLTRNQAVLAEFLIEHKKDIAIMGDPTIIFDSVVNWLKYGVRKERNAPESRGSDQEL